MMQVFEDATALAHAVAQLFADEARKAVAVRGRFLVALAGGETPRLAYELLAQQPYRSKVPWAHVHFFWGDDRCVPLRDARSNHSMVRHVMLDHLPVHAGQIHPIYCVGATPQKAAAEYELGLKGFFSGAAPVFDLVLLGLGEDGHTASLLPGSAALAERQRWTAVTRRPEETFSRVTLTLPILNQARHAVFVVSGESKAPILQAIFQHPDSATPYPAQALSLPHGRLDWMCDRAAFPGA
jgi:6-phosphogluconolactonase